MTSLPLGKYRGSLDRGALGSDALMTVLRYVGARAVKNPARERASKLEGPGFARMVQVSRAMRNAEDCAAFPLSWEYG